MTRAAAKPSEGPRFSRRMRLRFLAGCALLAACAPTGRHGPIDASRFVPATDAQLQLLLGDFPNPGESPAATMHDAHGAVVAFPRERAHFADEVVAYEVGDPAPLPEGQDPRTALGPPDYAPDKWALPRAVSLGNGGSLTLKFNEGALVDGEGPDLFIWEIGPSVEAMNVEVSADGKKWISVGQAPGGACAIDIGPYVGREDVFHYVRLRDVPFQGGESEAWPGADIDAVAILGSARRLSLSSEVLFAFDSDTLVDGAAAELDAIVKAVAADPSARLTIEGHTDDVGADEYNRALSERRAEAVARYFELKGISRMRIVARGLGKTRPAAPNADEDGRRKNRRVEILIQGR